MATQLRHFRPPSAFNFNNAYGDVAIAYSVVPRRPSRTVIGSLNAFSPSASRKLIESWSIWIIQDREADAAIASKGYTLLDIRPAWEWKKAHVSGSINIPLFVEDKDNGPITLLKKWVHFAYIGLWMGQCFTTTNENFVKQVEREVPDKDAKLLVACGEGLWSTMAVSKLYNEGYRNLGWLAGGLRMAISQALKAEKNCNMPPMEGYPTSFSYSFSYRLREATDNDDYSLSALQ